MKKSPIKSKPKTMAKPSPKIDKSKEKKDKVQETKSKEVKTSNKPAGREDLAFKQAYRDWYMGKLAL